jgi:hypothetical protein
VAVAAEMLMGRQALRNSNPKGRNAKCEGLIME